MFYGLISHYTLITHILTFHRRWRWVWNLFRDAYTNLLSTNHTPDVRFRKVSTDFTVCVLVARYRPIIRPKEPFFFWCAHNYEEYATKRARFTTGAIGSIKHSRRFVSLYVFYGFQRASHRNRLNIHVSYQKNGETRSFGVYSPH